MGRREPESEPESEPEAEPEAEPVTGGTSWTPRGRLHSMDCVDMVIGKKYIYALYFLGSSLDI